jgi:hypothetical protein
MIEGSPAMLAQRRACAAIQRKQAGSKPLPGTAKLLRTEHLLAVLQQKHSEALLERFAAGSVPDALSETGSLSAAWGAYAGLLADAVNEPAAALAQVLDGQGGSEQAGEGAAVCEGLAALALRISAMRGLGDPAAIASAAAGIRKEIAHLRQLFAALVAALRHRRGGDAWDSIKRPSSGMPAAPQPETTAQPAKEAKPGEQVNGS